MYKRVVIALIGIVAVFIGASRLRHPVHHSIPSVPAPAGDAGLTRRVERISFNGISRREALERLRVLAHLTNVVLELPANQPGYDFGMEVPVMLDLQNVTVETALRLIFGGRVDSSAVGGDTIVLTCEGGGIGPHHVYDVHDLVAPPTAASLPTPPGYYHTPPTYRPDDDWYGIDGIHSHPHDIILPPGEETALASTVDEDLRFSFDASGVDNGEGLIPEGQLLPGRLIGSVSPEVNRRIAAVLEQLRHPLELYAPRAPAESVLGRRLPSFTLATLPLDQAIERLRKISGAEIALLARGPDGVDLSKAPAPLENADSSLGEVLTSVVRRVPGVLGNIPEVSEIDGLVCVDLAGGRYHYDGELRVYDVRHLLAHHNGWLSAPQPLPDGGSPAPSAEQWEADSLMRCIYLDYRTGNWMAEGSVRPGNGVMRYWHGRLMLLNDPESQRQVWIYLHHIHETGKLPKVPE